MKEIMKECIAAIAVLLPVIACVITGWRFCKQDKGSWQFAACFAGLTIATSIVLLAASGRVSFVRYGEAVVQMDQKLEEIRRLTEQNKQIAQRTVEFVRRTTSGAVSGAIFGSDGSGGGPAVVDQSAMDLLKAAGLTDAEIRQFLGKLNQTNSSTNNP